MKANNLYVGSVFVLLVVFAVYNLGVSDVRSKPPAATPTPEATPTPTGGPEGVTPTPTPTATATPTATPVPIPVKLDAWAWSSNIGWVDFREIKIDKDTGLLTGYAWSPNIGWIKFHDLSDYPSGGAKGGPAKINLTNGKVSGWVRACAGTVGGETPKYGADCRSMNSRTDGWDGWIELSDDKQSDNRVHMDMKTGEVYGFAWGSNVIGWLKFGSGAVNTEFTGTCSGSSDTKGVVTYVGQGSGGSGDFWYRWNETGNYTKNNSFKIANATGDSVTAQLSIMDMQQGKIVTPVCPTVNRRGTNINGSCKINGQVGANLSLFSGDSINISLSDVWGGTGGPFTYKLFAGNGLEDFANPTTKTFVGPIDTPVYVVAKDAKGIVTSNISCGNINIVNRELTLKIGPNGNTANLAEYRIKTGSVFGLKWKNTLPKYSKDYIDSSSNPDGYTCTRTIPASAGTNWNNWTKNESEISSVSDLTTKDTGKFTFAIECRSQKFGQMTASVILNVVSTTQIEF